jgi:hypothetical protein
MLWGPLHPDPDGAALSADDRKIVIGVYPIRITNVTSGADVGLRGRRGYYPGLNPPLLGNYYHAIDRTLEEL